MILIAGVDRSDNDIQIILKYANLCNYNVVMRSGGHQFSGLSSCIHQCIQIDLIDYNEIKIIDKNKNIVKVGVGVELQSLYSTLNDNGLFVPAGTTTIGVGGHFQTGGIGYLLRSFGAFCDILQIIKMFLQIYFLKVMVVNSFTAPLPNNNDGDGKGRCKSAGLMLNMECKCRDNCDGDRCKPLSKYDGHARKMCINWCTIYKCIAGIILCI